MCIRDRLESISIFVPILEVPAFPGAKNSSSNLWLDLILDPIECSLPPEPINNTFNLFHSHSIVPGGLLVISYTTLFTSSTSFTIRLEMFAKVS